MSRHLNLPVPAKVSTDSITISYFQTSLILLEGLFILVCGLISLRSLLLRSFRLSFHDSTSTFNLTLYILFSPLITPISSHPFSGSPPFPFPEFTALSFFLLFLDRS